MRWLALIAVSGLFQLPAAADEHAPVLLAEAARRLAVKEAAMAVHDQFGRATGRPAREVALVVAIGKARKPDFAETNFAAWSEVLLKCQQATNPAWTTALMRSDPQQAHCYRY